MRELSTISRSSVRQYCMLQSAIEPFRMLLLLFVIKDAEFSGKVDSFSYILIIDKIIIIVVLLILRKVITLAHNQISAYFIMMALAYALFEYYINTRPYYIGYIYFIFLYNSAKHLSILAGFNIKAIVLIHAVTYAYHLFRMLVIVLAVDHSFPIYAAIVLLANSIVFDIPYIILLASYTNLTINKDKLVNDFHYIIDIMPNPIIIIDSNRIALTNKAANSTFNTDEIYGIIHESHILTSQISSSFQHKAKSYTLKAIRLNTTAFGSSSLLISIFDNTDVIKAEKEAASENAKWMFINSTCHQIRTPLSGIECSLSMLGKSCAEGDQESINRFLNLSLISVVGLRHIVDGSIYLYEDIVSSITVHNTEFDFGDILTEIKKNFSYETTSKKLEFLVDSHAYPHRFISDRKLIFYAIYTILMNSFKYTLSGTVKLTHQEEIVNDAQAKLCITIDDTGTGMSEHTLNNVFKVFNSASTSQSEHNTSNGISLYIVKRISDILNGGITFSSKIGHGSHFNLWITVSRADNNTSKVATKHRKSSKRDIQILIVDDNSTNIYVLNSMITRLHAKCDVAHNGAEAVAMYDSKCYELIFMDINMPVMNGYEASRRIKGRSKDIKKKLLIVACSAQNEPMEDKFKAYGIDNWLEKPLRYENVQDCISMAYTLE